MNYNDSAHVHAVTHIGSTQKYWYDANGSQTKRIVGADTYDLKYDAENRLIEVKKNSTVIATYTYDGDGQQVKSVINGVTTYFAGAHYHVENGQVTKYYFAGAQRVAVRKNGTLSYMLSDHLGSTVGITNTSGTLTGGTLYKAWGETRYTLGTIPTKFKYTGQREESAFGLYFYQARWYDSTVGRFTSADTVVPAGVQGLDRYAYTNNNPIRYNDPTGHCAVFCAIALTGLLVATPFVLSALSVTPDYIGIDIATAVTRGGGDAVVAAGIAVQSQYPWAIVGGSGQGWAQATGAELAEGENPYSLDVSVKVMEERINDAIGDCTKCKTGVDKLIVAAIAQNGYEIDFPSLPLTEDKTIDWQAFFESNIGSNTDDPFAQFRQDVTGMDFSAEFMLKLYIQDLRELLKKGYDLPEWVTEEDIKYIEDNYLD